jgi:hypothetical protein
MFRSATRPSSGGVAGVANFNNYLISNIDILTILFRNVSLTK